MEDFIGKISISIQKGKVDIYSPYPPDMKGLPGAFELTGMALENDSQEWLLKTEFLQTISSLRL